jgi:hypothetical protein
MKHTLSPTIEYALVALVAVYGLFALYLASVEPFAVITTADIRSLRPRVDLDTDTWERRVDLDEDYVYGLPPGWIVDASDPARIRLAPSLRHLPVAGVGTGLVVEALTLGERRQIENVAAEEFAGRRPALYDVSVDGHEGLFVVDFEGRRLRRQVVYVPRDGRALVVRGGTTDPAAFAAFVSTIKFIE